MYNIAIAIAINAAEIFILLFIFWKIYFKLNEQLKNTESAYLKNIQSRLIMEDQLLIHDNSPFPRWRKNAEGVMISLNQSYEDVYLKKKNRTNKEYIGKKCVEMWGSEIGNIYWKNDLYVLQTGQTMVKREKIDQQTFHVIIKWLSFGADGSKYVEGMSFPDDIFHEKLFNN